MMLIHRLRQQGEVKKDVCLNLTLLKACVQYDLIKCLCVWSRSAEGEGGSVGVPPTKKEYRDDPFHQVGLHAELTAHTVHGTVLQGRWDACSLSTRDKRYTSAPGLQTLGLTRRPPHRWAGGHIGEYLFRIIK